jgi:hypothetical protein
VATLPLATRHDLERDAIAVATAMRSGISRGRHATTATYERIWRLFCEQHGLDPFLSTVPDPVTWLQIFAARIRDGRLSASKNSVRSGTVADALNFVAQTFTFLGHTDPRFAPNSYTIDPRLLRQLKGYAKADAPPARVKPLPLPILHQAFSSAQSSEDETALAAADMMWLAFFFLLCPGEYTMPAEDSHPFRLCDVRFWLHSAPVDVATCPPLTLLSCTFVSFTFSTQKNGIRGESIGHGHTQSPTACPVRAAARRVLYLRSINAPPTSFLCAVGPQFIPISSSVVTSLLRRACTSLGNPAGFSSANISAKSLRASGVMALLNSNVDQDIIQLIGRWRSDASLRYLHVQAQDIMQGFSARMLQGGTYSLIPDPTTPTSPLLR